MEIIRKDGIKLKINILEEDIIHINAGGFDDYQEGLLNRYGFINKLPNSQNALFEQQTVSLANAYQLQVDDDLSFRLIHKEKVLFETKSSYKPATAPTVFGNKGYKLSLSMGENEKFIGLGDQYRQGFLLNGQKESLWIRNQSDYIPVPFFMSSQGYGILLNTTRRIFYDFGVEKPNESSFGVEKDYLNIYIFTANNYWEIIRKYTFLTGRPQMPPMYTFGIWLVCHTEIRAHELLQLALETRNAKIPCDLLSLEPLWMKKLYDDSLEKNWNEERFPYFNWVKKEDSFIGSLNGMGYHFGLWMLSDYDHTWEEEKKLGLEVKAYCEAEDIISKEHIDIVEEDEHFGHLPMLMDKVTKPEEPFFEHLKKFVDQGVDFFKQDGYAQINIHPDRLYGNMRHDDEMHNIHYMIYSKQMINNFEEHTGRRAFGLMVAGWAGFQRYPGTWAGDTGGGDQAVCSILQLSTVGHAFATCDIETESVSGIHMGLLLPWSQISSWASYKYPAYKGERYKNIFRNYANLRMQLLYFYYSLAYEATQTGRAIARPMHLMYPEIDSAYNLLKQYFLGNAFLVGNYSSSIVLPEGKWFDYWTNQIYTGDWSEQSLPYPDSKGGHLLLKEGAIVPIISEQQYVGEKEAEKILWQIFPAEGTTEFELYLDNGIDFEFKQNAFASAKISCSKKGNIIDITWGEITGKEQERISELKYDFEVLGFTNINFVKVDSQTYEFTINNNRTIIKSLKYGQNISIKVN